MTTMILARRHLIVLWRIENRRGSQFSRQLSIVEQHWRRMGYGYMENSMGARNLDMKDAYRAQIWRSSSRLKENYRPREGWRSIAVQKNRTGKREHIWSIKSQKWRQQGTWITRDKGAKDTSSSLGPGDRRMGEERNIVQPKLLSFMAILHAWLGLGITTGLHIPR